MLHEHLFSRWTLQQYTFPTPQYSTDNTIFTIENIYSQNIIKTVYTSVLMSKPRSVLFENINSKPSLILNPKTAMSSLTHVRYLDNGVLINRCYLTELNGMHLNTPLRRVLSFLLVRMSSSCGECPRVLCGGLMNPTRRAMATSTCGRQNIT